MIKWDNPVLISFALEAGVRGLCYPGTGDSGECWSSGMSAGGECESGGSAGNDCESGTSPGPGRYCTTGTVGV